jgi:hypothetical protein
MIRLKIYKNEENDNFQKLKLKINYEKPAYPNFYKINLLKYLKI